MIDAREQRSTADKALVLCTRIGHTGGAPIPAGTQTADCYECGAAVWISAAVQTLVRASRTTAVYVCDGYAPLHRRK